MLSYDEFGRLRLADFMDPDDIREEDNWEYMDRIWIGEASGFTEFLRLKEKPDELRVMALHLECLAEEVATAICSACSLQVQRRADCTCR